MTGDRGALAMRAPDGRQFLIGTGFSEAQRRDPPAVGSAVIYRHRDLAVTGLLRFANFSLVHQPL